MSKNKNANPLRRRASIPPPAQSMEAFTFGEPVPVLDKREILDYVECIDNGQWYEPPVSFSGLAKSMRAAVHHSSPMYVKRNILVSTFVPHERLSRQDFSRFALDYIVFGNAFIERRLSLSGRPVKYETSPAKYTRRAWRRTLTGLFRISHSRTSLRRVRSFTCWSLTSTRSFTGCRNISARLIRPG
jgi:hypothetical protein